MSLWAITEEDHFNAEIKEMEWGAEKAGPCVHCGGPPELFWDRFGWKVEWAQLRCRDCKAYSEKRLFLRHSTLVIVTRSCPCLLGGV